MPVFISHRQVDGPFAVQICNYLKSKQVPCWVDELDEDVKTTNDITSVILSRLDTCTHLLAVVSAKTEGSWWVPFEIGVATHGDRRIASYKKDFVRLPDYLDKWPKLSSPAHLDYFVQMYNQDRAQLEKRAYSESARYAQIKSASDFHSQLKRAIGQY